MSKRDEQKVDGAMKQSRLGVEGRHGDKTHARLIEQLHSRPSEESAHEGKRRLVEDREQHDEGERNSEKVRLAKDLARGTEPGPSDNQESLHGVLDHREHRADYQPRDESGFHSKS